MDNPTDSDWQIDRQNGLITHPDGFAAEMSMGQVRNIVRLPAGIATRDICRYIAAAERAWSSAPIPRVVADAEGPSKIAARIGHGPARRKNVAAETPEWARESESERASEGPTIKVKRRRKPLMGSDSE